MATTTSNVKYGVDVGVPQKSLVKSKIKKNLGLNYPIGTNLGTKITGTNVNKNKTTNYFNSNSGLELLKNNLRQLLLTEKGERVMLPDFGLGLRKFLFEPLDETLVRIIKDHILFGLTKYAKSVRVLNLNVYEDASNSNGVKTTGSFASESGRLNIKLTLQLKDETREVFEVGVLLQ